MNKRIAIVNQVGFDGGGGTTLCLQYAKLGIDVLIKDYVMPGKYLPILSDNIIKFSATQELIRLAQKYDRLIFVNLWYGKISKNVLDNLLLLRTHYPTLELCYLHCFRKTDDLQQLLTLGNEVQFKFDHIYSLNPTVKEFSDSFTVMNINAITVPKYVHVPVDNRRKIIFSSGRVEAFKGITKYILAINERFLTQTGSFTYIHEGATFNKHKQSEGISCTPQLLSVFELGVSPKVVKAQYALKQYGEDADASKFNIYPEYNLNDVQERWSYYYAGICCILGTKSGYITTRSLVGSDSFISDSRERIAIDKAAVQWNDDLEYADMEKICAGVPVFFSHRYAEIIGFTDRRLIYDSFYDISPYF